MAKQLAAIERAERARAALIKSVRRGCGQLRQRRPNGKRLPVVNDVPAE